jgi:MFS family permease
MLAMFRRGLFYAYLSIYLRHFLGLSVTETTLFTTLPMTLNILSQTFVWGKISDRFQLRRTLIVTGELLAAAGTVILWYIHRLPDSHKMAGYAIIGGLTITEIFWSMSNIGWSALISDIYDAKDRSRIQGRLSSMGGFGRIFGVWIGGLLYDGFGTRYAGWGFYAGSLWFVASFVMVISIIPLFLLPEGGVRAENRPLPDSQKTPSDDVNLKPLLIFFLIGMVFINFGRNSIVIIIPQYFTLESGLAMTSQTLSYVVNTQSIAIVLFGWVVGWIGTRLGNGPALLIGTLCAIISHLILVVFTNIPMLLFSGFLRGVADVVIMASAYAFASVLISPELRARGFAWFNATFFLSWGLAGTLIAGPMIDAVIAAGHAQIWAYRASFAAAAGITFIGFCLQFVLLRRMPRFAYRSKEKSNADAGPLQA